MFVWNQHGREVWLLMLIGDVGLARHPRSQQSLLSACGSDHLHGIFLLCYRVPHFDVMYTIPILRTRTKHCSVPATFNLHASRVIGNTKARHAAGAIQRVAQLSRSDRLVAGAEVTNMMPVSYIGGPRYAIRVIGRHRSTKEVAGYSHPVLLLSPFQMQASPDPTQSREGVSKCTTATAVLPKSTSKAFPESQTSPSEATTPPPDPAGHDAAEQAAASLAWGHSMWLDHSHRSCKLATSRFHFLDQPYRSLYLRKFELDRSCFAG